MGDQREQTKSLISNALDALEGLSKDEREAAPEEFQRLARLIDYARIIIEKTDPELVLPETWAELDQELTTIGEQAGSNVVLFTQRVARHLTGLSNVIQKFPVARGRLGEQRLAEVLAEAEKRSAEKIGRLEKRIDEHQQREEALQASLVAKEEELQQYVNDRKAEMDTAVSESTTKLADAEARIESAITSQADDFRSAQEERANKFNEASEAREAKLDELVEGAETRTNEVISAAEEAMKKATSAAGALGLTGSSERYSTEADQQKKGANTWRWITVFIVGLAVGAGIWAATAESGETSALVGRLAIGVALGALAAYTATQSGRHRDREEDTREIALDLAAFNSFIEPLSEQKDKDTERRELGKRIFGQQLAARSRTDQPGPGLVDQIAERVRATLGREAPPTDPNASG